MPWWLNLGAPETTSVNWNMEKNPCYSLGKA